MGTITQELCLEDPETGDEIFVAEIEIEYETSGRHLPATWGWDGGSPEEWPEVEIVLVHSDHGPVPWEWVFGGGGWQPEWALDREKIEELCSEHMRERADERESRRY